MPSERPEFMIVSCKLTQPDSVLLNWSEEEKDSFSDADQLGASLEASQDLYKDLQDTYKVSV